MIPPPASQIFKVHRHEPELITPSEPTPHEFKLLSDLDDQEGHRFHLPTVFFYPNNPSMEGKDPAKMIREAVAKTLVFYYPMAGRLREGPNRKLIVECTGEGILFIEADADVTLEQFGDPLMPPFPCSDELLFDVPGSSGILNSPLLLIQVTRLNCGGFIFGLRYNHTMFDGFGLVQFVSCIAEMAKGACAPSVLPVWERHIFNARNPPQVTYQHSEYDQKFEPKTTTHISRSFFFGPNEISTLRRLIPPHLRHFTTYELLTACVWKCRTIALQPDPAEEMHVMSIINLRNKLKHLVPAGYYGTGFVLSGVVTTAKELSQNPLSFMLELVRKSKDNVTEGFVRSSIDLMIIKDRPHFTTRRCCIMSGVTRTGLREVDFGWGKAVYGGPFEGSVTDCCFVSVKNKNELEDGIVLVICLPTQAMERFAEELNNMLQQHPTLVSAL